MNWLYWILGIESSEPYSDGQRKIYTYWNGSRWVHADPLPLYKRVMEKGPILSADIKAANSGTQFAKPAHDKLVENIRSIFNITPLKNGVECDGTLTDAQVATLLDSFLEWCEGVKKNSSPPAILSTCSEPNASSDENLATCSSSESGSTGGESTTAAVGP